MTASIAQSAPGAVYAFIDKLAVRPCVMVNGTPVVEAMLDVRELERWVTTLEEVLPNVPISHYGTLTLLLIRLQVVLDEHKQQHEEIVSSAPTEEDMMEYLNAYSKAMMPR